MEIVKAKISDLEQILEVYKIAKQFMRDNGNPLQWQGDYPNRDLLISDIDKGELFIITESDFVEAVFSLNFGKDKFYEYIEGEWLNNDDYVAIHKVASRGRKKGLLRKIVEFSLESSDNIRIDTHENNDVMKHLIEKNGFTYCGKIFVEDGTERLAYHLTKK